jgi:hypothetical protein
MCKIAIDNRNLKPRRKLANSGRKIVPRFGISAVDTAMMMNSGIIPDNGGPRLGIISNLTPK